MMAVPRSSTARPRREAPVVLDPALVDCHRPFVEDAATTDRVAALPMMVLPKILRSPSLAMPPPSSAALLATVQSLGAWQSRD